MHHGAVAEAKTRNCCAGVSATPRCFFGTGGSLRVTGLVVTSPQLLRSRECAGYQTGNVPHGLRAQWARLLCLAVMPATFEEAVPFATEMERCDFAQRHGQQFRCEIGGQFPVSFDGLGSEFLFGMLAKELSRTASRAWWEAPRQPC